MGDPKAWLISYQTQLLSAMIEYDVNTQEMINRGMSATRRREKPWLPSPGEFCAWCRPNVKDFGLPTLAEAFHDARMQCGKHAAYRRWRHEAIYLAAAETGFFDLSSVGDRDPNLPAVRARFEDAYNRCVDRVMAGEELALPESQRIAQKPTDWGNPRHKRAGEQALGKLRAMLDD